LRQGKEEKVRKDKREGEGTSVRVREKKERRWGRKT
jgi:hypothetical protein